MRKNLTVYSGIAILFVVLIHSNAYYLHHINLNLTTNLMKLLINLINIAVPMFVFIAGYKYELAKKKRDIKKYYNSKINNIIKPTIIISFIWIVCLLSLSIVKKVFEGQSINTLLYIKILLYRIGQVFIGNNDIYQLWYIPMYIFITFLYPIIEKYIKGLRKMGLFSILAIFQAIGSSYIVILNKHPLDFIYYFFLFEMGILFYNIECKIKINRIMLAIIYSILLIVSISISPGIINKLFIKILMYPIGVVVFYNIAVDLKNSKILNKVGKYSFCIYVLHEPVILSKLSLIVEKMGIYISWIWVPIISCFTILICIYLYKFTLIFKIGRFFWNKDSNIVSIENSIEMKV